SNRVRVELRCSSLGGDDWRVDFEERADVLGVAMYRPAWSLSDDQKTCLNNALTGWFKLAGVQSVRGTCGKIVDLHGFEISWAQWLEAWDFQGRPLSFGPVLD